MDKLKKIKSIKEYKKEKKNKNKRVARTKRLKVFCFALGLLSIAVVNLYGYALVSELKYEIHYLKEDLNKEQISLENAKQKTNETNATVDLEEKIKDQLNMNYPKENQIEYIN